MIRVVIADDHTLVRTALRALVSALDQVEVVAEAGNGLEAVEVTTRFRPDVVLMDLGMPELNGFDATERIVHDVPGTRVIIISMIGSEDYVAQALRRGAVGYLLKDAEAGELEFALRAVARGETYLSPEAATHARTLAVRGEPADERLTSRQREILQLVVEGCSTKDIAARLSVGIRTVDSHRLELMERLGIHDLPGLVRYAIRAGLVPP